MTTLRREETNLSTEQTKPIKKGRYIKAAGTDFRLILVGSAALLLVILLGQRLAFIQPGRLVLGVVYILFVPGYCLASALFPRGEDLDRLERAGLSLGLSIAWAPVLAIILDALPWGLRLWPIAAGELASIGLFMVIALWRRARLPAGEAYAPALTWQPGPWWRSLPRFERRIYWLSAAALMLALTATALVFLIPSPDEYMTELYMLGTDGLAEDFPRESRAGEDVAVTLGIVNRERDDRIYRVEVRVSDPWTQGRSLVVARSGPYAVARGEKREWPLNWQMPWAGPDQKVEFLLFSGDDPDPYRRLQLFLNVTE